MALYPKLTITDAGKQMLIQAQNGHTMTFTCGKLGSGTVTETDNIATFTDLKSAKMTLPITKVNDSNPEKLVLTFDASNKNLNEGFTSRELGIFAKLDNGAETLYAYSNAGNNYDYISSKDTPTDESRIDVSIVTSSQAFITVMVDGSIVYLTKNDVDELMTAHDQSSDAHFKLASTIDDSLEPKTDTDTIRNQLSELANRIKEAGGTNGWKDNPAINLASLSTFVTNLASGSDVVWDGKKFTNSKLGISGLMDTNGYVSFGPNFGGLIIQWGMFFNTDGLSAITYPIALSSKPWAIIPTEGDPAGWQASNGIAVAGADLKTASNTQANILTKLVFSNGTMEQGGQTIRVFIIGT